MSSGGGDGPHPASWLVGCVLVGWVLVYNLMRLAGSGPADSAWLSLVIGGGAGAVGFVGALFAMRRLQAAGRVVRERPAEIPPPAALTAGQRRLVTATWPLLAALAAVALALGVALGADWFGAPPADRAITLLVLAAWNLLVAVWVGDEALRLMRGEADGLESVALGAALTAILAAVGLTRGYFAGGQVALIVLAGLAGAAAALLVWRLRGGRTPPVAAPVVAVVAVVALVLASA